MTPPPPPIWFAGQILWKNVPTWIYILGIGETILWLQPQHYFFVEIAYGFLSLTSKLLMGYVLYVNVLFSSTYYDIFKIPLEHITKI